MALEPAETAHLRQPGIVVNAHFQIRVADRRRAGFELICEAEHTGIAAQFLRDEIEITVQGAPQNAARTHGAKVADEPAQTHEIALIERHQADEAAGLRSPSGLAPLIRQHAWNYTTQLLDVRAAGAVRCRCGREFCSKFLRSRLPSHRAPELHASRTT